MAGYRRSPALTIRWATPADTHRLRILADLDETPVPPVPLLLAFADDELWAALSVSTGTLIANPFRWSAELAALLVERGRQLTVSELA